jgi:hypothetical protein
MACVLKTDYKRRLRESPPEIFHTQHLQKTPAGVMFNVKVIGFSAYHNETLDHRQDKFVSNSAGISVKDITRPPIVEAFGRLLHFWWAGGNRSEPMLVTANRTPMGISAPTPGKYVGLKYVEGIRPRWSLFYEDELLQRNSLFLFLFSRSIHKTKVRFGFFGQELRESKLLPIDFPQHQFRYW